jgi:hypothetical protein
MNYNQMSVPIYPLKECSLQDPKTVILENFSDQQLCLINDDPIYFMQTENLEEVKQNMARRDETRYFASLQINKP